MNFDFDPKELQRQQDDAANQKKWLAITGGIGDALASQQSFGNFLTGKMNAPSTAVSRAANAVSDSIQDPIDRQAKLFAGYKQSLEGKELQQNAEASARKRDPNSKESMALKALAPRWGIQVSPEMSAHDIEQMIDPRRMMETEAKSKVDFQNDIKKLQYSKQAELDKWKAEQDVKKAEGLTEGRKAVDKDFAKEYNDWNSGGRATVDKNLKRLRDAYETLGSDDSLTGGFVGNVPDSIRAVTNPKAIVTRDDVRAAAQGALKATLGAQFTEKEGERIMNMAYNDRLSPAENRKKIQAAIDELEQKRSALEAKSSHFEKRGTLTGFEGVDKGDAQFAGGGKSPQELALAELERRKAARKNAGVK